MRFEWLMTWPSRFCAFGCSVPCIGTFTSSEALSTSNLRAFMYISVNIVFNHPSCVVLVDFCGEKKFSVFFQIQVFPTTPERTSLVKK
jgi:hypothetical protein